MIIQLGYVLEDNIYINKTFNPIDFEGYLKDDCSIITGEFVVQANISEIAKYNYCYIPAFKRYYYITDITSNTSSTAAINIKVDVLMSFKKEILNSEAIITRNEFMYSPYVGDKKKVIQTNPVIVTKPFSRPQNTQGETYILITSGGTDNGNS